MADSINYQLAKFVASYGKVSQIPESTCPEVSFVGRSNVGKSSMINRVCTRGRLAKVSGTPGKTRLLNVFRINDDFHLVDLPGYGFARVSKAEQRRWAGMMEGYFAGSSLLCHVLHLVDIRHEPTAEDREMNAFLRASGLPFSVVATKADKISRGARMKHIAAICRALQVQPWEVIPFSSEDGTGRDAVLALFDRVLAPPEAAES